MKKWKRYLFKTTAVEDSRPVIYNPTCPSWETGIGEGYATRVAYLPADEPLEKYWPEAYDVSFTEEDAIVFTDRFPRPEGFQEVNEQIGPGWAGTVTREVIVPLAEAIERQFGGKRFSSMFSEYHALSPFPSPRGEGARAEAHRRIDTIKPVLNENDAYIYIIVRNQWTIFLGTFVCLTQRGLFTERLYGDGSYEAWCWILED